LQVKISEWQFFIHYILWQPLLWFNGETSVIFYQHVSYFSMREEKEHGDSCPVNSVQLSRKSLLISKGFRVSVTRSKRVQKNKKKSYPLGNQNHWTKQKARWYYTILLFRNKLLMRGPAFMLILVISGSKTQIDSRAPDSQEP